MNYSENQVRHLYVVKDVKTGSDKPATAGDIKVLTQNGDLYFSHYGAGGLTRTDLIPIANVEYVNVTASDDMKKYLKIATISGIKNTSGVVPAGTYIVRIAIHNFVGMSDEDTYFKYGQVTSNGSLSVADFCTNMATSLQKNLSRDVETLFTVTSTSTTVVISEAKQSWVLGKKALTQLYFDVNLVAIDDEFAISTSGAATTYDWGTVTMSNNTTAPIYNSQDIADLEYFSMGERADLYRGAGYPNDIKTTYLADGSQANGYHVIDIHYSYVGDNQSVQKSEKTITLVGATAATMKSVADDIATAVGSSKVKYSASAETAGLK